MSFKLGQSGSASDAVSRTTSSGRLFITVAGMVLWAAAAGHGAGRVWMAWWSPPTGRAVGGTWYPDPWDEGNRAAFDATATFVVVAAVVGLSIGILALMLSRIGELAVVLGALLGSCLAVWLMVQYAVDVVPPDPTAAARDAADGTVLWGTLVTPAWSTRAILPGVTMLTVALWFLLVVPRRTREDFPDSGAVV